MHYNIDWQFAKEIKFFRGTQYSILGDDSIPSLVFLAYITLLYSSIPPLFTVCIVYRYSNVKQADIVYLFSSHACVISSQLQCYHHPT